MKLRQYKYEFPIIFAQLGREDSTFLREEMTKAIPINRTSWLKYIYSQVDDIYLIDDEKLKVWVKILNKHIENARFTLNNIKRYKKMGIEPDIKKVKFYHILKNHEQLCATDN